MTFSESSTIHCASPSFAFLNERMNFDTVRIDHEVWSVTQLYPSWNVLSLWHHLKFRHGCWVTAMSIFRSLIKGPGWPTGLETNLTVWGVSWNVNLNQESEKNPLSSLWVPHRASLRHEEMHGIRAQSTWVTSVHGCIQEEVVGILSGFLVRDVKLTFCHFIDCYLFQTWLLAFLLLEYSLKSRMGWGSKNSFKMCL